VHIEGGTVRTEQATLQGTVITVSEPTDAAAQPAVVLVLPSTFTPREGGSGSATVTSASVDAGPFGAARIVESHPAEAAVANLEEASIIVAGGRGVGGADGFALVRQIAEALGGAVGATRAAVDSGWIPYAQQIGQTGKIVKPKLYLALGISGAIQHKVGMQTAETIIAINRDPDAPIAEFADLLVVGDLFEVGKAVLEELGARK
jgi:electron transfer flavoprotein alpha subunit